MKFEDIQLPSNRKFGFFLAAIFLAFALYFFLINLPVIKEIFLLIAVIILAVALKKPDLLLPFNILWMRFGFLLGKIVSPFVLGAIFFLLITPIALVMMITGRDELRLKMKDRASHWKKRDPIGPEPSSFKNQF